MTVAGVMSGTSADGIDVAVVRIVPGKLRRPKLTLLAHEGFAFPPHCADTVLAAMNAQSTSTAELARLNWRLGIAYAEAVKQTTAKRHKLAARSGRLPRADALPSAARRTVCGPKICVHVAGGRGAGDRRQHSQVPVVSNFRPADMLAGGQGAPLVPLLDYVLFADAKRGRVLQNIGGIANLTAIPAGAAPQAVIAFDTGPGNMVIDWLAQKLFGKPFDRNGALAARGAVLEPVLEETLRNPYFRLKPPRTAGREQFGREYAAEFLDIVPAAEQKPERRAGDRDGADGGDHRAKLRAICRSRR